MRKKRRRGRSDEETHERLRRTHCRRDSTAGRHGARRKHSTIINRFVRLSLLHMSHMILTASSEVTLPSGQVTRLVTAAKEETARATVAIASLKTMIAVSAMTVQLKLGKRTRRE